MTSKIKIKLGPIEVEYEGPEAFLKKDLPELLAAVARLHRDTGLPGPNENEEGAGEQTRELGGGKKVTGTTKTIAGKLECKSGPDLAIAAAARLTFVQGKDQFTRSALRAEMRTASSYYKKSYTNNMGKILDGLVKSGKLQEPVDDSLALSVTERKRLEGHLAPS